MLNFMGCRCFFWSKAVFTAKAFQADYQHFLLPGWSCRPEDNGQIGRKRQGDHFDAKILWEVLLPSYLGLRPRRSLLRMRPMENTNKIWFWPMLAIDLESAFNFVWPVRPETSAEEWQLWRIAVESFGENSDLCGFEYDVFAEKPCV